MLKKSLKALVLLMSAFFILSCSQEDQYGSTDGGSGNPAGSDSTSGSGDFAGGNSDIDSLFVVEGKTSLFSVSDEKYWSSQGYTLWTLLDDVPAVGNADFSVKVSKSAGTDEAGYGIVFGHVSSVYHKDCMQVVLLNTKGQFTVGELIGTDYSTYYSWSTKDYINIGYNVENLIKVSYNKTRATYYIYINDNLAASIWAPRYSGVSAGKNGYIAVVSPKDRLPDEKVCVKYTLQ